MRSGAVVLIERGQRRHAVGHVVGGLELLGGEPDRVRLCGGGEQIEADVLQRAASGARGVGRIGPVGRHLAIGRGQFGVEMQADQRAQAGAGAEDGVGIDIPADLAGDVGLARQIAAPRR